MKVGERKRVADDTLTISPQHFRGVLDFDAAAKASVNFFLVLFLAGYDGLNGQGRSVTFGTIFAVCVAACEDAHLGHFEGFHAC
jgi:hypothetical protein